jgi:hypothetical protein
VHGIVMRLLCVIGIHKWINVTQTDRQSVRCEIRDRITGKRNANTMSMELLFDRVCQCCHERDDQIARAQEEIEAEEQIRWKRLSE